jgi:hypothetical protein
MKEHPAKPAALATVSEEAPPNPVNGKTDPTRLSSPTTTEDEEAAYTLVKMSYAAFSVVHCHHPYSFASLPSSANTPEEDSDTTGFSSNDSPPNIAHGQQGTLREDDETDGEGQEPAERDPRRRSKNCQYVSTLTEEHRLLRRSSRLEERQDELTIAGPRKSTPGSRPGSVLDHSNWDASMRRLDRESDARAGVKTRWGADNKMTLEESNEWSMWISLIQYPTGAKVVANTEPHSEC